MKARLFCIVFFSFSMYCFAQKHTLTGIVYDEEKKVLADANVIVKNSEEGVITNEKGQFSIKVEADDVLEISFLGFETKSLVISNETKIQIDLVKKIDELDIVYINPKGVKLKPVKIDCPEPSSSSRKRLSCLAYGMKITPIKIPEIVTATLFPNPSTNGLFQLQLNEHYTQLTLEVFNLNGQLLQSNTYTKLSKNPQIDLSKQAKGIYLIKITADGNTLETKKAIRS